MIQRILAAALLLAALPAWGATTFYTNATTFGTTATGMGITMSGMFNFAGQMLGPVFTNVGGTGVDFIASTSYIDPAGGWATFSPPSGGNLKLDTPGTVYALALYLSRPVSIAPSSITYNYQGGSTLGPLSLPFSPAQFLGVISDSGPLPDVFLHLASGQNGLVIQNFQIGTMSVAEAPEPPTFTLTGGVLLALPLLARRWRRRSTLFF
jgi:hypothetical protein